MTTTAPPRRPTRRAGRGPGPGAAQAEALRGASLETSQRPSLRLVRPPRRFRPRVLGTLAVTIGFVTLFVLAAMQAVLVQGQLKLDALQREISSRETAKDRLQVKIDLLESPDRLAREAKAQGMVMPPEVPFIYSPYASSASSEAAAAAPPTSGPASASASASSAAHG